MNRLKGFPPFDELSEEKQKHVLDAVKPILDAEKARKTERVKEWLLAHCIDLVAVLIAIISLIVSITGKG